MTAIVPTYLSSHYSAKELVDKLAAGSVPYTREYEVLVTEGQGFWSFGGKGYAIATLVYGIFWAVSRAITLSPLALTFGNYYRVLWAIYSIAACVHSKFQESKASVVEDIYRKMQCYIDAKYFEKARFLEEKNIVDKSQDKAVGKLTRLSTAFDQGKADLPQPVVDEHAKLRADVEAILKRDPLIKPAYSHKWYKGCFIHYHNWYKVEAQWTRFRNSCHRYYHGFSLNHEGMRTYMCVYQDPNAVAPQYLVGRWD